MEKYQNITNDQFKKLMEDIYITGQSSKTIEMSEFIKEVESKMLSLMVGQMYRKISSK